MPDPPASPASWTSSSPPAVLIVDRDEAVTTAYARLLRREGYGVTVVGDGPSALTSIARNPPDVVLLEMTIPGLDGLEVCRRLKREPATRLTPVILLTASSGKEQRIAGLEAGADEVFTKPGDADELLARVRALARVKRYTDDLDSAASIVITLAIMIESRDGYTEGHCHRMANYATALGRSLQLGSDDLQALHRAGFLHDIGMLAVPEAVLRKSGPLTVEEYQLIKSHTIVGAFLVEGLHSLRAVRPIIRHHHERYDGSGYPDGLRGDDIPLLAQIIGLVDAYDAVTTRRPYQDAKRVEEAILVLRDHAARGWRRPDLVERFVGLVKSGKVAV